MPADKELIAQIQEEIRRRVLRGDGRPQQWKRISADSPDVPWCLPDLRHRSRN